MRRKFLFHQEWEQALIDVVTPQLCGIAHFPAGMPDWPCAPAVPSPHNPPPHNLPPQSPEAEKASASDARPASLRVLLVEDEPGDAHLVKRALNKISTPHFFVTHVDTLAGGLEAVTREDAFDVVLLDLSLPDSFGMRTLMSMQAAAPHLPIVIMTGHDDPEFAENMLEAGAQDYLVKGGDPGSMVARAIRYAITRMAAQIERNILTEQVMEHQRSLMQELAVARGMQFDLLPSPGKMNPLLQHLGIGVESCFEPSSSIGGDLWGCIDCGNDKIAFYTFDFSGHGVGAALNVFRLHALIGNQWRQTIDPGEFLSGLGKVLNGLLRRGQFATMFVGVLDCRSNELAWSSAGAPSPFMIDAGTITNLDTRGMPLGLLSSAQYNTRRMSFPVGASLFLYSDAMTEAETSDKTMLGEDGLLALLRESLRAFSGALRIAPVLSAFRDKAILPLQDDLTAVCVTRLQSVGQEG